jgi:hypothetical protein
MKNALIFVDGGVVKVVFGSSIKVMRPDEVGLGHNKEFLGKLFAGHRVLFVERAAEMSMDEFLSGVSAKLVRQPEPESKTQRLPASAIAVGPARQARPGSAPGPEPSGQWIKSNAKTIIIIDDLPTNDELAPGIKKALSLQPGRVTSLGALDQAKVAASTTLRRLIQNGTVSFSDPTEAMRLDIEHDEMTQQENDARLAQYSPIIEGPAHDYASRGLPDETHGAAMMEITDDAPARPNPEDSGTMSDLMSMIADDSGVPAEEPRAEPAPRRPLAARPRPEAVDPTSVARRIGRKHEPE